MRRLRVVLMIAMFPLAFLTGYLARGTPPPITTGPATPTVTPPEHSVEAGFTRDMSIHHGQAVDMAERIRQRSNDDAIRTLATDIVLTQQNQIGQFRGWLEQWHLPTSSNDAPMSWMTTLSATETSRTGSDTSPPTITHQMTGMDNTGHPTGASAMPGMASRAAVNALSTLPLAEAERSFLKLMIAHHQGGVAMAKAALTRTTRPEVLRIARSIVASQTGEITAMRQLLATRTGGQS